MKQPKYVLCIEDTGTNLTAGKIYKTDWYNDIFYRVKSDTGNFTSCFITRFIQVPKKYTKSRLVKLIYDVKK